MTESIKKCPKCGEQKTTIEFGKSAKTKDGMRSWCKECERKSSKICYNKNPEKERKRSRECAARRRLKNPELHKKAWMRWYNKNREKVQNFQRERRNGRNRFVTVLLESKSHSKRLGYVPCLSTVEEVEALFTGKCHICGIPEIEMNHRLHLDHCHTSGRARGFLCANCNHALGHFHDSTEIIESAIHYLRGDRKIDTNVRVIT